MYIVPIHLRAGGLHGAQITAVEIRPHRAAEEINTPDTDLFIKQQFHMRMFVFEPRFESIVLFVHWPPRVIFVVSRHIEGWFLPLPQNCVERVIIPERDDIASQDQDISVGIRRQHPARAKFKMQVAISNDSHARKRTLFEPVFLKSQISSDSGSTRRGARSWK